MSDPATGDRLYDAIWLIKIDQPHRWAIWFVKRQGDYLKDVVMTADTTKERLVTGFPGQDKRFITSV